MNATASAHHLVFDRALVRRRRARAAAGFGAFDFLKNEIAERIVERLEPIQRRFDLVLDLGAHHGALARQIVGQFGAAHVITLDMAHAFAQASGPLTIVGDEEALPIADQCLDLVVSALSLHWVNDLPGTLIQINRALKPDGLFIASLFGLGTLVELREALMAAELEISGGSAPHISPFLDARDGAGLLQRAGFALPVAERDSLTVTYADPLALMRDLRGMGETNCLIDRDRRPLRRAVLGRALEIYAERYANPDGRIRATFEIVTLTGWAPHEAQQKPLLPGSAKTRLAKALGTIEQSAGEKAGGGG
jgi:SAM-dependent methyltransferase